MYSPEMKEIEIAVKRSPLRAPASTSVSLYELVGIHNLNYVTSHPIMYFEYAAIPTKHSNIEHKYEKEVTKFLFRPARFFLNFQIQITFSSGRDCYISYIQQAFFPLLVYLRRILRSRRQRIKAFLFFPYKPLITSMIRTINSLCIIRSLLIAILS